MKPDPDFSFVREDPVPPLPSGYDDLLDNVEKVRAGADGEWHRIGRFPGKHEAQTRRAALRRRKGFELFQFKTIRLHPSDDGFESALYCKWVGVVKRRQSTPPPPEEPHLRSVPK